MTDGLGAAGVSAEDERWADALMAAELLAHAPDTLKGVVVRAGAGPVRDGWLAHFSRALGDGRPVRRLPSGVGDERLTGSLDLSATLSLGRPVAERGLLAEVDGGVLIVPMAERLSDQVSARLVSALDRGEVEDVFGRAQPARFSLILLDEGTADERPPLPLMERLAFQVELDGLRPESEVELETPHPEQPVKTHDGHIEALCATAEAFGIASIRAPMLGLKVAQASASLDGRSETNDDDLLVAARLVLAPRATRMPPMEAPPEQEAAPPEPPPPEQQPGDQPEPQAESPPPDDGDGKQELSPQELADLVVEATRAALPPGLMQALVSGRPPRGSAMGGRGAGAMKKTPRNGRRAGVRAGALRHGARLDLVETLKVAAPWQALRRREAPERTGVLVRRDDFRIRRLVKRSESTTIFVVDASGSAAIARLGEAKGAVELLLAEAYVRRDEVALIAFRADRAEVLLPPTRSLPRARRQLGDLAGGGGTPLASAIEAAEQLAAAVRSKGRTPLIVFLTDGRANVARDGAPGGVKALEEAMVMARRLREAGLVTVFIDTASRARSEGPSLALAMGARYVALPRVQAEAVRDAVKAAREPGRGSNR